MRKPTRTIAYMYTAVGIAYVPIAVGYFLEGRRGFGAFWAVLALAWLVMGWYWLTRIYPMHIRAWESMRRTEEILAGLYGSQRSKADLS